MGQWFLEGTRKVLVTENREIELNYYITEENAASLKKTVYGIAVEKKETDGVETETTGGISDRREVAVRLLRRLMEGTVTPVSLINTVDDMVTAGL